jgi:5-methylcytosine-specific restriction endonuclease McrA
MKKGFFGMKTLDRSDKNDAKYLFEKFIPDPDNRKKFIRFLADSLTHVNSLNQYKWNLNLDKSSGLIRSNIGQCYCITLTKKDILVVTHRDEVIKIRKMFDGKIKYSGYGTDGNVITEKIEGTPDSLHSVKGSIGCIFRHDQVDLLPLLKPSLHHFTKIAIKSTLSYGSPNAHSTGAIAYMSEVLNEKIPNPLYAVNNYTTYDDFIKKQDKNFQNSQKLSDNKLNARIAKTSKKAIKQTVLQTVYRRNPDVVEKVLRRAKGKCELCGAVAPFKRDSNETPYLEVHHKIPLSENGHDAVENAIALCPNCHRHAHYGKKTFKLEELHNAT